MLATANQHSIKIKDFLQFANIHLNFGDTKSSFALQASPEEVPEPVVEIQVIEGVNSLGLFFLMGVGIISELKNYT